MDAKQFEALLEVLRSINSAIVLGVAVLQNINVEGYEGADNDTFERYNGFVERGFVDNEQDKLEKLCGLKKG